MASCRLGGRGTATTTEQGLIKENCELLANGKGDTIAATTSYNRLVTENSELLAKKSMSLVYKVCRVVVVIIIEM